ncbi:MAG: hypothetical protein ACJ74W_10265 [Pyrinomonadaceae bacterium]
MRFKSLLLPVTCAAALAACTSGTNTNQTTTTNGPASSTAQTTVTTTQTTASPQAPSAAVPGATASTNPATSANAPGQRDACALLTADEIKAVQGEASKETKVSQREDGSFAIAQCFYTTPTFTKSISLEVTEAQTGGKESPRAFWAEHFTRATKEGSERERGRDKDQDKDKDKTQPRSEEEEEGAPPEQVRGVGDEAYWVNSRVSGALYVLKGNRFIRISLGGADSDANRQKKAKMLAQKALARL